MFFKYFEQLKDHQIGKVSEPPPLRLLIHGGPGVGKSFVADRLIHIARSLNYEVMRMS